MFIGNSGNADGPRRVTCKSASLNFSVGSCEGWEGAIADGKDTHVLEYRPRCTLTARETAHCSTDGPSVNGMCLVNAVTGDVES